MTQIVGGIDVKDVIESGTTFDVIHPPGEPPENDVEDKVNFTEALESHLNFDCLSINKEDAGEPFDEIALSMTNLLPNGKIMKKIIREGYGNKPESGSCVKIDYNAYVQYEAQPFDSTYARKQPHSFCVDESEVIEGLDIAVMSMKINEKAQFLIVPELAYKDSGMDRIPPNSRVLFEVEMKDIVKNEGVSKADRKDPKSFSDVFKWCTAMCLKGKNAFRLQDYGAAVREYNMAAKTLEKTALNDYNDQIECDKLLVRLYTNMLVCHTIMEAPKRGCFCANQVYAIARGGTVAVTAKVYFNNAKCLKMLGDFALARRRFQKALNLEPQNEEIKNELLELEKSVNKYKTDQKALGKALIGSPSK